MGKPVPEPKRFVLSARFTREEKRALMEIAKKRRLPVSEVIRERLLGTGLGA
jgi:hypothetical protein